ncbi:MAG: ubiquinone/menaquinone biosynthesis methyltransferase [Hyphomonadaceae bacterium]|nr:MAG: ubiquinone/menaquinone biosynthesis methyltransferase [Hyphomonadaceae bacterium]
MSDISTTNFGFQTVPTAQKAGKVREVFDAVAQKYDIMNDLMSGGLHRVWKDAVATRLNPRPGEVIIDMAGGTGDLARRFKARVDKIRAKNGGEPAKIIVADINQEMIMAGRERGLDGLDWTVCDAENLPIPDKSVDAYVISFGIRNVTDIPKALREAQRVLKHGGRFYCLEFSRPTTDALQKIYDLWSFKAIPKIGEMVMGDAAPYQYLVESIAKFPDQETFKKMIQDAGFSQVSVTNFAGGIVALHGGWVL